eukprot:TRINITY_DN3061_c0_g1_i1.p1 TRINITY_DN3061_c0_g1~~TRINITY_DN3061_c0_g1_i1.p1  ORF type:complete len:125 (-),score=1.84 TRINITY_DN3061_c0_g1_i1:134-457(-)
MAPAAMCSVEWRIQEKKGERAHTWGMGDECFLCMRWNLCCSRGGCVERGTVPAPLFLAPPRRRASVAVMCRSLLKCAGYLSEESGDRGGGGLVTQTLLLSVCLERLW